MSAGSAGIVQGAGYNRFSPNIYILGLMRRRSFLVHWITLVKKIGYSIFLKVISVDFSCSDADAV